MKNPIKYYLPIITFFFIGICNSQINFIPNFSFENTNACPNIGPLNNAQYWVNSNKSSPDYFNSCNFAVNGVPSNVAGFQNAHSGNAYAGFSSYYDSWPSNEFREYIQTQLDSTLTLGETYCTTFYVSLANNWGGYAVNNIGAYFSPLAVSSTNYDSLPYIPQIINPSTNPLTDTSSWMEISGQFMAKGGERYITIGNFNGNATSDTLFVQTSTNSYKESYYYIDDVSVIHLDAGAGKAKGVCNGIGVTLGRSTQPGITYSWHPSAGLSDTAIAQPIATPTVTTTYYLTATLTRSGCSKTDSVKVLYIPTSPSATITTAQINLCPGETGNATVTVSNAISPYSYNWSNGTSAGSVSVSGLTAGTYTVTVTDANTCTATTAIIFSNISAPTALIGTAQTTITEGEQVILNGSGGINYLWSPIATLSCYTCQNPTARPTSTTTYTLAITAANGCKDTSDITIKVNPLCLDEKTIFIPNAFSPNNDGNNDVLHIRGTGLTNMYWGIYDRWGNLVFEAYDQTHPWDGTLKGSAVEAGVYSYYLRGTCVKTYGLVTLKGNVSIVK